MKQVFKIIIFAIIFVVLFLVNKNNSGFVFAQNDFPAGFVYGNSGDTFLTGDFNNDKTDTPAAVRGNHWLLKNSNTTGNADLDFVFGEAGDQKLLCDWDGDGIATPGVYRGNTFYLKNSNSTGNADITFAYGTAGMKAVCGDWDGDGKDTVGVISGNTWYLKNSNTTGNADITFIYGQVGDKPFVGDWDGDGKDTPGVLQGNTFALRNSNTTGLGDISFVFGNPGDTPIAGDWDGNGSDEVGVVRGNAWYLRSSLAQSSSSPGTLPGGTLYYKIAETEAGLSSAPQQDYNNYPTILDFKFADSKPGTKQIWVQFIGPNNVTRTEHTTVEILDLAPAVNSLSCSMDISKQTLLLTLNGQRLGNGSGKISANGKDAQIISWSDSKVTASVKPDGGLDEGKLFKVILTGSDGQALPEVNCLVNTTVLSLGARLFCREPGKFDVNNVTVVLVDENGNKVSEQVSIDKDGLIKNLKTKLQIGKLYSVSIKAPYSLRKNGLFTASDGTNVVNSDDGTPFILPVGDIAPVILPDGKINTFDRGELVRQWSVLGTTTGKTGDFNRDAKVNSIDWACMRVDFNKEDEAIPDRAAYPAPSTNPSPTAQPTASAVISSPTPTATPVSSPSPSSSGVAYFLFAPQGSGSYQLNTEFGVDLNIWSQNQSANLFAAKLKFDPSILEVVRIEKGTALSSWAEDFFDNSAGTISLTAGLPSPGIKTTEGNDPKMATIIFKAKQRVNGTTKLDLLSSSKIYSNANNTNILGGLVSTEIAIPFPPD